MKKVNRVYAIYFLTNYNYKGIVSNYIVVEDYEGICLLYDTLHGRDLSNDENLYLIPDNGSKKVVLYHLNKNDYQFDFEVGEIDNISVHKRCGLYDRCTNEELTISNILDFEFKDGKNMYLDFLHNNIFIVDDCIYMCYDDKVYKCIEIFRKNKSYKVKPRMFKDFSCKYFGSCFEYVD